MNKKRSNYIYQLVGIVKEKRKIYRKNGRKGFKIVVNLPNQPEINWILVYQDKIINQQIWKDLEEINFIGKKYLFNCQNHFGNYHLKNWQELNNHG